MGGYTCLHSCGFPLHLCKLTLPSTNLHYVTLKKVWPFSLSPSWTSTITPLFPVWVHGSFTSRHHWIARGRVDIGAAWAAQAATDRRWVAEPLTRGAVQGQAVRRVLPTRHQNRLQRCSQVWFSIRGSVYWQKLVIQLMEAINLFSVALLVQGGRAPRRLFFVDKIVVQMSAQFC